MARDSDSEDDQAGEAHEPRECMACRGTGSVISNLGGTPKQVDCPWCGGTGVRQADRDAQAHWRGREGADEGVDETTEPPAGGAA